MGKSATPRAGTSLLLLAAALALGAGLAGALLLGYAAREAGAQTATNVEAMGWMRDDWGQTTIPEAAKSGVKTVAAGNIHSIALKEDGSVVTWGYGNIGAWGGHLLNDSDVPSQARSGVTAVAAGFDFSLAAKETDTTPPAAVGSFTAAADPVGGRVKLSWTNPTDVDFTSVRILRSTARFAGYGPEPSADDTQSVVYEGTAQSFTDTNVTDKTTYFYTAYAYDGRNWSAWNTVNATPFDQTPPDTVLGNGGPSGVVGSTTAAFEFTSTEAGSTFECSLNGGSFETCESGKAYENLDDGPHTFDVRAVDAGRNADASPARREWTVDTGPPDTTMVPEPSGTTNNTTAAFALSSTERNSTFECSLDGGDFAACDSPKELTGLSDGSHAFRVRATDAAGNADATPARRTWTVDAIVPAEPEITSPVDGSSHTDGSFVVSGTAEKGSTVRLFEGATRVGTDEADPGSGAWRIVLSGVSDGRHAYEAQATDAAGNDSARSVSRVVTVDGAAPSVVRVDPKSGAKSVARRANVIVTFSETMRPDTVSRATVKLIRSGKVVPAKVTYDAGAKRATLNPGARLVAGATYKAVVSTGTRDAAGNPLSAARVWRFSVEP